MHGKSTKHIGQLKHILRYIKWTLNYGINYEQNLGLPIEYLPWIQEWSDANWANDDFFCKSTLGYVFTLVGGVVSWQIKHQQTIALFSTKVEYIARTSRTRVAIWIKQIMKDIGFHHLGPLLLHCYNNNA